MMNDFRTQVIDTLPMLAAAGVVAAVLAHLPLAVIILLALLFLLLVTYGISRRLS